MKQKKVIVITDGDTYARKTLEFIAGKLGGTCLAYLADNPTKVNAEQVIKAVLEATDDPVYVLLDDAGTTGVGSGERILLQLSKHEQIEMIGAVAVASHTKNAEWSRFTIAIDQDGEIIPYGVNKEGIPIPELGRINGDTVYLLDQLDLPVVVAVGDIGKMQGKDDVKKGSPITRKAIEFILERGGIQYERHKTNDNDSPEN